VPAEIHLIFTEKGQREVEDRLLGPGGGLELYRRAYGPVPEPTSHLVERDGEAVRDVRSEADNVAVADKLAEVVGELCTREGTRVHVSIALVHGGWRTDGA
jgi:CRISPR-associated protein (TIGR02584 family)